jgi:hypothetical protein
MPGHQRSLPGLGSGGAEDGPGEVARPGWLYRLVLAADDRGFEMGPQAWVRIEAA